MKRYLVLISLIFAFVLTVPGWAQEYGTPGPERGKRIEELYKNGHHKTIRGRVMRIGPAPMMMRGPRGPHGPHGMGPGPRGPMHRVAMLVNTGEAIVPVVIGPEWFLRENEYPIQPGDEITVKGSIVQLRNKPVMLAQVLRGQNGTLKLRKPNGLPLWARGEGA